MSVVKAVPHPIAITLELPTRALVEVGFDSYPKLDASTEITVEVGNSSCELDIEVEIDVEDEWSEIESKIDAFFFEVDIDVLLQRLAVEYLDSVEPDSPTFIEQAQAAYEKVTAK